MTQPNRSLEIFGNILVNILVAGKESSIQMTKELAAGRITKNRVMLQSYSVTSSKQILGLCRPAMVLL